MLAMAKSMSAVCSRVGLIYGDRLTRLPRRLGFDATTEALEQSHEVLEDDWPNTPKLPAEWLDEGSRLAREIVTSIAGASSAAAMRAPICMPQCWRIWRMHMVVSAEVDAVRAPRRVEALCRWSARLFAAAACGERTFFRISGAGQSAWPSGLPAPIQRTASTC